MPDRADSFDESKVKREKNGRFGSKPKSQTNNATQPLTKQQEKAKVSLKGTKTSKGIEIKHVTKHANQRMRERNISEKRAVNVFSNPDKEPVRDLTHGGKNTYRYERGSLAGFIDHSDGTIITVMIKGKSRR